MKTFYLILMLTAPGPRFQALQAGPFEGLAACQQALEAVKQAGRKPGQGNCKRCQTFWVKSGVCVARG